MPTALSQWGLFVKTSLSWIIFADDRWRIRIVRRHVQQPIHQALVARTVQRLATLRGRMGGNPGELSMWLDMSHSERGRTARCARSPRASFQVHCNYTNGLRYCHRLSSAIELAHLSNITSVRQSMTKNSSARGKLDVHSSTVALRYILPRHCL